MRLIILFWRVIKMTQLNAYIHFNGNCREAMEFYKNCFGGNLQISTFAGSPMESQVPPALKDKIIQHGREGY